LVTVTAGGNDIGYIGSMFAAAWAAWIGNHTPFRGMKNRPIPAVSDEALERAAQGLAGVVEAIRGRAPRAEVVLVDYFTLIGDQTTTGPTSPFGEEAIAALRRTGKQLAQVFLDAADRTGATLVELSEASEGHALGSPEPWVTGFQPMTRGVASFHPNAEGMQAAAQLIWHRLGN
jgi:lysophospholipase L1-like esterase